MGPTPDPFDPSSLAGDLSCLGAEAGRAADLARDLRERHAEPGRHHHGAEHVAEVLAEVDRLVALDGGRVDEATASSVRFAGRFHDAIYDLHAAGGGSEAASADLAVRSLASCGLDPRDPVVQEVDRLIRLTAGHEVDPADGAGALLVDADLWILSAPPARYDRYAIAVRAEYAHVPDDLWIAGRGALLERFLASAGDLYGFGPSSDRADRRRRARANLTRELAGLR